jgi:hypothetical protein
LLGREHRNGAPQEWLGRADRAVGDGKARRGCWPPPSGGGPGRRTRPDRLVSPKGRGDPLVRPVEQRATVPHSIRTARCVDRLAPAPGSERSR